MDKMDKMKNYFKSGKKGKKKVNTHAPLFNAKYALPAPDVAGTAFGRYVSYGNRSLFGRRYFGTRSSFRKKVMSIPKFGNHNMMPNSMMFGNYRKMQLPEMGTRLPMFGRRRKSSRKTSSRKSKKPSSRLIKMCKKFGIKCTRKVGKHRVYKSTTVLKRQLKKKMKHKNHKNNKNIKKRRKGRRSSFFGMF